MKQKKLVIIGGGLSGLSAGIYALKAGYEAEIFDKNKMPGGFCSGRETQEGTMEFGTHWLIGVRNGTGLNKIWRELGVLDDYTKFVNPQYLFSMRLGGETVTLWKDLERTKEELIKLSPADKEEIIKFLSSIKLVQSLNMPVGKPMDMMSPFEYLRVGISMANIVKVEKEYGKINIKELADRFKHPSIKRALISYLDKDIKAISLIVVYASFTSGDANILSSGSCKIVNHMLNSFKLLGGIYHESIEVKKINIVNKEAVSILCSDNSIIKANDFVCACDAFHIFNKLIDVEYIEKQMKQAFINKETYPVFSEFQVVLETEKSGIYNENLLIPYKDFKIGNFTSEVLSISDYEYGTSNTRQIHASISIPKSYFGLWKELYSDKENYRKFCNDATEKIVCELMKIPEYRDTKMKITDIMTPITYKHHANAFAGAMKNFNSTKNSEANLSFSGKIKGLDNVILAGQWIMPPGGMAQAVVTGKFAVMRLEKKNK